MVLRRLSCLDAHSNWMGIWPNSRWRASFGVFECAVILIIVLIRVLSTLHKICTSSFTMPCQASELKSIELISIELLTAFHFSFSNALEVLHLQLLLFDSLFPNPCFFLVWIVPLWVPDLLITSHRYFSFLDSCILLECTFSSLQLSHFDPTWITLHLFSEKLNFTASMNLFIAVFTFIDWDLFSCLLGLRERMQQFLLEVYLVLE